MSWVAVQSLLLMVNLLNRIFWIGMYLLSKSFTIPFLASRILDLRQKKRLKSSWMNMGMRIMQFKILNTVGIETALTK